MLVSSASTNITILLIFVWYLYYHWKRRRLYRMASQFSGPLSLPIVGNALYFAVPNTVLLEKLQRTMLQYQSPMRMWFGQQLTILVYTPKDCEIILNSPHALTKEKMVYKHYEFALGSGLGTAPVATWKRHRKVIAPFFKQNKLYEFTPIFVKYSNILVTELKQEVNNGLFDVFYYLNRCTIDMISETTMGVKINAQTTNCEVIRWLVRALDVIYLRVSKIWYHFDFIFNRTQLAVELGDILNNVVGFVQNIITKARTNYKLEQIKDIEQPLVSIEEEKQNSNALLQQLIKLSDEGVHFTDKELQDEVVTFLTAGSETTASVMGFTLIVLGIFQDVQERVFDELINIVGTERNVANEDLIKFEYLERVIKETMRIFPTGVAAIRSVTQDIQLETCTVPAGSSAAVLMLGLHRNPDFWPDPLKFDPDRFLPEEAAKRDSYSYLPFSGGPRNCVGIKYAWMSMKSILGTLLRRYRVSTCFKSIDDVKLKLTVTLRPARGYMVKLEPREN